MNFDRFQIKRFRGWEVDDVIRIKVGIHGGLDNAYTLRKAPGATIHCYTEALNAKNGRVLLVN